RDFSDRFRTALGTDVREGVFHFQKDSVSDLVSPGLLPHSLGRDKCAVVPVRRVVDMTKAKHVRGREPFEQVLFLSRSRLSIGRHLRPEYQGVDIGDLLLGWLVEADFYFGERDHWDGAI